MATGLPTITLVFTNSNGESIELDAEIADDSKERARGLMFRETLPENAGMIFVYDEDHIGGFYMRNTFVPLSIAFVTSDGMILDIQDMEPQTLELHRPGDVYRYAVEANQGWYVDNDITIGDTVAIPDGIATS